MLKNLWRYSRLRFYVLNTLWNYKFWLFAKKVYRDVNHVVIDHEKYEMDIFSLRPSKKTITSKRFSGYLFESKIYHDNPGLQGIDSETWQAWKRKGLIE